MSLDAQARIRRFASWMLLLIRSIAARRNDPGILKSHALPKGNDSVKPAHEPLQALGSNLKLGVNVVRRNRRNPPTEYDDANCFSSIHDMLHLRRPPCPVPVFLGPLYAPW